MAVGSSARRTRSGSNGPEAATPLAGEPPAGRTAADILAERETPADALAAMTAVASIQRVAMRIRHHLEQGVLKESELTWSGFMVLWVLWMFGELQTRYLAEEVGVNRSTLSGVLATLQRRGLLTRRGHESEGRLVLVALTDDGRALVDKLFPPFCAEETFVVSGLSADAMRRLGNSLRTVAQQLDSDEGRQRRSAPARGR
jgi:DNA-binding MarR family transcriptional regulator